MKKKGEILSSLKRNWNGEGDRFVTRDKMYIEIDSSRKDR